MSEQKIESKKIFTTLVKAAENSDRLAQSELIELTQNKLFKFCMMLGRNRELAEDLCQEVYIKAFRSLKNLKNPESFQSWLYQIAKNLFIDHKRSQKKMTDEIPDESVDAHQESILEVTKVLSHFDIEDRYLVLLIEFEGCTYKEAAEQLKTSEDAIRSKLHRLRQEIENKLKK